MLIMARVDKRDYGSQDKNTYNLYVDGNLAYVSEPAPELEPERNPEKYVDSRTRRNRARARSIDLRSVGFFAIGLLIVAGACTALIYSQATLNRAKSQVASLSDELITLKDTNDAAMLRIEQGVDVEAIREKAIKEFGMVYPTSDQVVTYSVKDSDYMEQYREVQ